MTTDDAALGAAGVLDAVGAAFADRRPTFEAALEHRRTRLRHGDAPAWRRALEALPGHPAGAARLDAAAPGVATGDDVDAGLLERTLRELAPWRKGPWRIGPVTIDSEWRSDLKWSRLSPHLADPAGRHVLDVGGGNGYFAFRLAGRGAATVLNIDPTPLFYFQFLAVQRYLRAERVAMLPVPLESLPGGGYDTVLSMGVLYHRRSPIHHLRRLRRQLRPGGELVLETLILDGGGDRVLVPPRRYARMRNVWFLPTLGALETWLARCGFDAIRAVDVTATTVEEQRETSWMPFESLQQALHPDDPSRTVEGHPAPLRAIVLAERGR